MKAYSPHWVHSPMPGREETAEQIAARRSWVVRLVEELAEDLARFQERHADHRQDRPEESFGRQRSRAGLGKLCSIRPTDACARGPATGGHGLGLTDLRQQTTGCREGRRSPSGG